MEEKIILENRSIYFAIVCTYHTFTPPHSHPYSLRSKYRKRSDIIEYILMLKLFKYSFLISNTSLIYIFKQNIIREATIPFVA